jgi:uncharacterized protein YaaR (DUF327 family)
MEISGYSAANGINGYKSEKAPSASSKDEEENFLSIFQAEAEDAEEKDKATMIDHLIEALKGEEKEVSMEGNKHIDAEDKIKYWQRFHGQLTGTGVYNGDIYFTSE